MKFSTLVALTATVSAKHLIDGAVAEAVQEQFYNATMDAADLIEDELIPSLEQWDRAQQASERIYKNATESNFNDFLQRGSGYEAKLDCISNQLDEAIRDLEDNVHSNLYLRSRRAAPQQLWSVGMTANKTAAVNQKLQKVAGDYMAFASDPVYGPFIEQT